MTNCYIVGCPKTRFGVVIDPGGNEKQILQILTENGLSLKYILLTHGHIDHIGAVAGLQKATGGEIVMNKKDSLLVRTAGIQAKLFGLERPPRFKVNRFTSDGDRFVIGTLDIKVIETPGHTSGGVCYLVGDYLFAGDTLFSNSIGRTDLPGGSYEQLIQSISTRLLHLPAETQVYPGHGSPTNIGRERKENPFLRAEARA